MRTMSAIDVGAVRRARARAAIAAAMAQPKLKSGYSLRKFFVEHVFIPRFLFRAEVALFVALHKQLPLTFA